MKLVKQVHLGLTEGRSDKVYEVDLCEVGPDRYVVNFRYGRRGSALKEGTKTPVAVSLVKAQALFDKVVNSKVSKGYQHESRGGASSTSGSSNAGKAALTASNDGEAAEDGARARAVLGRLAEGDIRHAKWPLDRAIWRAGELRLAEAVPMLIDLLDKRAVPQTRRMKPHLRQYGLIFALGRCGAEAVKEVAPRIAKHFYDRREDASVRRIAAEALRGLLQGDDLATFIAEQVDLLPTELQSLVRQGPADEFQETFMSGVRAHQGFRDAVPSLYLIDNPWVRPALLKFAQTIETERPFWKVLRYLYKAAEFRRDGELFGIIAHRVETSRVGFDRHHYLRRRTARTLRRMGQDKDPAFAKMAAGVLAPFSSARDAEPVKTGRYPTYPDGYDWRRGPTWVHRKWGPYARYWAFNFLLYTNGPQYEPDPRGRFWRQKPDAPEEVRASLRQEAFPELWNQAPEVVADLLVNSDADPVHRFGVNVLRARPDFLDGVSLSLLVALLERPFEVTAQLGFEWAQKRYDALNPDWDLLLAVVECEMAEAREIARGWIDAHRLKLSEDSQFMANLVTSRHADNRVFARRLLLATVLLDDVARLLFGRLVARLNEFSQDDESRAKDVVEVVTQALGRILPRVGVDVVRDLLGHPLPAVQELAGAILVAKADAGQDVPDDLMLGLFDAKHEAVRALGAQLLGRLSDDALMGRQELLLGLSTHKLADLRSSIRPVVARLAGRAEFVEGFAARLVEGLLRKAADGVHRHVLQLLKTDLASGLASVSKAQVMALLKARSGPAQELGGVLLERNVSAADLSIQQIVKLASHEIYSVRHASWTMFEASLDRVKKALSVGVRILDATWEDSRAFGFRFFRETLTKDDLPPSILVAICDSVRPEVQALGTELITRYFEEDHGHEYLLKLSEHPSTTLQMFVTNYLEQYAAGDASRLQGLEPYFLGVLSRVNKGRVAKTRSLAFLQREGLADEARAEVVAKILTRQSATCAIMDKGRLIETMLRIHQAYPSVSVPLTVIEPTLREVRDGV